MNLSKVEGMLDLYMPEDELEDFKQYLSIAIEDLINVRPMNPKRYLALALCRSLPLSDSLRFDFPELSKDLTIDTFQKPNPNSDLSPDSPNRTTEFDYPEGVQVSRRASVYGESIAEEELAWTPPSFPKPPGTLEKLKGLLQVNILFSHLNELNLSTVAMALEPLEISAEETLFKQHEEGSSCYFVESGKLSCFVQERGFVCEYVTGDSFGEASIMYENLRGATIRVWPI